MMREYTVHQYNYYSSRCLNERLYYWNFHLKAECLLLRVKAEVKHIIYCHGWQSNTLHHKRISFQHNLFKTCIDTQVEGSIQNRHVCSSNFKYFQYLLWPHPNTADTQQPCALTKFTYNQLNHLFSPNLFLLPFFICFPFLSHNCHFSPLFFGHNDNLKSIRVVLKVASISRLSVLFVCLVSPRSLSHIILFFVQF